MKRIIILTEGQKISGPSTWEEGLAKILRKSGFEVIEINATRVTALSRFRELLKADIVHGYHVSGASLPLLYLSRLLKKPVVFTVHGNYIQEAKNKKGLKKLFWVTFHRKCIKISNTTTVPSRYLYDALRKDVLPSKKIIVIPNGIKISRKNIRFSQKNIHELLEVTQFNLKEKSIAVIPLIEAVEELGNEFNNLTLSIVGDGPYLQKVKESVKNINRVKFLGKLTHEEAIKKIEGCDLFVHASYLETFGYSVLEAMSFNKPIVATGIGGIVEITDKRCLVKPNKNAIKGKIKEFITKPKLLEEVILSNNAMLAKFSWTTVGEKFTSIYNSYV